LGESAIRVAVFVRVLVDVGNALDDVDVCRWQAGRKGPDLCPTLIGCDGTIYYNGMMQGRAIAVQRHLRFDFEHDRPRSLAISHLDQRFEIFE